MARRSPAPRAEIPSFETLLARLEEIADRLEGEPLELDGSLALFEEGVSLLRQADTRLAAGEAHVRRLLEDDTLAPLDG